MAAHDALKRFLTSVIGRKMLMAVTGLLLIGFLIAHMSGNLLIFVSPEAFNDYSHALISNPLIYIAEFGLLALFVAHLASGILVTRNNKLARPVAYQADEYAGAPSRKSIASSTMIYSGILVLLFVPLHLWSFKFGAYYESAADPGVRDLHRLVIEKFAHAGYVAWYVLAMIVIGFHLWHGFGSGFESLGVKYRKGLRRFGQALAVVIAGGFTMIPLLVYFMGEQP